MEKKSNSLTMKNLEAAFAGESMAHIRYLYFAKMCRKAGDEESAKLFEETAAQEVQHALSHAQLIYPEESATPVFCLETAIAGETYEYCEMYPSFRKDAVAEQQESAVKEIDEQIAESKAHAEQFQQCLKVAAKRFAILTKIEKRHAQQYSEALNKIS